MQNEFFELENSIKIPKIMLGTYPLKGYELIKTVRAAVKLGYIGIDAASAYGNERWVALSKMSMPIKQKKMFITTKFNVFDKKVDVRQELLGSMKRLNKKTIDLYLMHWPHPNNYIDSWKQMEELYLEGKVKAIGVCNFKQRHLENLLKYAKIKPMVNQIEIHPLYYQKELIEYCQSQKIQLEAYCPLAQMNSLLKERNILENLAKKYNKKVSQIILRWDIQQGIIPLPRTTKFERLKENIDIFDFELNEEEVELINSLNKNYKIYDEEKYCPGY